MTVEGNTTCHRFCMAPQVIANLSHWLPSIISVLEVLLSAPMHHVLHASNAQQRSHGLTTHHSDYACFN